MILLSALVLVLSLTINTYAAATPSDFSFDPGDVYMDQDEYYDYRGIENEQIEMDYDKYSDSDSASGSSLLQSLKDLLLDQQHEDVLLHELDIAAEMATPSDYKKKSLTATRDVDSYHKNVVVYHGHFNGYECDLVIPYDGYSKLDVINNVIVNVSNTAVTGRILYDGDHLDPAVYDTYSYIMNPIYGSTSNVYTYGSFNYRRHYYLNTNSGYNRITYDDMYGNFYVDDIDVYYTNSERVYYLGLVSLLMMGVIWLWLRRH